jgi:hypothetical protein
MGILHFKRVTIRDFFVAVAFSVLALTQVQADKLEQVQENCLLNQLKSMVQSARIHTFTDGYPSKLFLRKSTPAETAKLDRILSEFQTRISDEKFKIPGSLAKLAVQTAKDPLWPIFPKYRLSKIGSLAFSWLIVWPLVSRVASHPMSLTITYLKKQVNTVVSEEERKKITKQIAEDFRLRDIKAAEQEGKLDPQSAVHDAEDRIAAYNSYLASAKSASPDIDITTFSTSFLTNPKAWPLFRVAEPFLISTTSPQGFRLGLAAPPSGYAKLDSSSAVLDSPAELQKVLRIANTEIFRLIRLPSWISSGRPKNDDGDQQEYDRLMNDPYERRLLQLTLSKDQLLYLISQDVYNQAHVEIEQSTGYFQSSENWPNRSASDVLNDMREPGPTQR